MKKLLAVIAAAAQIAVLAPMSMAAEEDAVAYSYDYTQYADGNAVKANGITINGTNSWGTPKTEITVADKTKVYWVGSLRGADSSDAEKVITTVDFTKNDTEGALAAADNNIVSVELDFGMLMKGYSSYASSYNIYLTGKDPDGNTVDIAKYTMSKESSGKTTAKGVFSGSSVTNSVTCNNGTSTLVVPQETYLRFDVDTAAKTFDGYYKQVALASGTAANTLVASGSDLAFIDSNAVTVSGLRFTTINAGSSDAFAPITMSATVLSDANTVALAKDTLDVTYTAGDAKITLPELSKATAISWASNNEAVIAADGTVTPAEEDTTVTLTATITKGAATDTKTFEITVNGTKTPEPEPETVDPNTVVYDYVYSNYATGAEAKTGAGVTTVNSWGTPGNNITVATIPSVYWLGSTKSTSETDTETIITKANFAVNDTEGKLAAATSDIVRVDLDFGMLLKGYASKVGVYNIYLTGKDAEGQDVDVACYTITKNGSYPTTATGAFKDSTVSNTVKATTGNVTTTPQETFLRFDVDTAAKTYDGYYMQKAVASGEADATMVSCGNMAFINDTAVSVSGLRIAMTNFGSSDVFAPVEMKVSILCDETIVEGVKDSLSVVDTTEKSIALPTASKGATIAWASSDESVIATDGTVTQAEEEKTVTLTATITKGEVSATKEFTVKVPKLYPVPEGGIWCDDEFDYSTVEDLPSYTDGEYGINLTNVEAGTDTTVENGGLYELTGSSIKLTKASDTSKAAAVYKKLAPSDYGDFDDNQVFEIGLNTENTPKVYIALESYTSWKGVQSIMVQDGYVWPNTSSKKVAVKDGALKLTVVINGEAKTTDIYVNNVLCWSTTAYRTKWSTEGDGTKGFGKVQIALPKEAPIGSSVAVDYIRVFEATSDMDAFDATLNNVEYFMFPITTTGVRASIKNNTADATSAVLYFAQFDADGRFIGTALTNAVVDAAATATASVEATLDETCSIYKAILVNDNLAALAASQAGIVEVKTEE